ncbi:MAG: T9SS type A sorting domain-containing protein [Saprospiraceae bacterium]|nr:T9SS type A sorting domain-containing protein [Saprospiraceae bacterium]
MLGTFSSPNSSVGQSIECSLDVPTQIVQKLIEKQPEIEEFIANFQPEGSAQLNNPVIPVRFTIINLDVPQLNLDFGIAALNSAFIANNMTFVQCSEANRIFDERIKSSEDIDQFITSFAYTSGALEVYFKPSTINPIAPIPDQRYLEGNQNYVPTFYEHTNWAKLNNQSDVGPNFVHETGHHFGLLHTYFNASVNYNDPPPPNANDFPYPVLDPLGQIVPTWWGRELVIRTEVPPGTKDHISPNHSFAGDLISDTPADCWAREIPSSFYPGCFFLSQNPPNAQTGGCDFNSLLTYKDYNGDPIFPAPAGLSLGRNFMSYWRPDCLNQFTPQQLNVVQFYYQTVRLPEYTPNKCGNFTDKIELEGTATGLHNVSVRVRHTGSNQKCNVTSGLDGKFSGILHQDILKTHVYLNGKRNVLNFANDKLKVHYDHTQCEWVKGVKVDDVQLISKHVLGITPLPNGYRLIAADANKSNSITGMDQLDLNKLILGIYPDFLPNQEQPFRYIPEFVPDLAPNQFNVNPFALLGGAYLEQGWEYQIPTNGKRGFDGIKIGDVNFSWINSPACPDENQEPENGTSAATLTVPNLGLNQHQIVGLTIKNETSLQIAGFQFGLKIPADKFEILDVLTNSLPGLTKEDNFGLNLFDPNAFTTIWMHPNGGALQLPVGSPFFTVLIKAKETIPNLQTALQIDDSVTPAFFNESFGADPLPSVGLVVQIDTLLSPRQTLQTPSIQEVLRCSPNPIIDEALITFLHQNVSENGLLSFKNFEGKTVYQQHVPLLSGSNHFTINTLGWLPPGTYLVCLETSNHLFSTKIIKQ